MERILDDEFYGAAVYIAASDDLLVRAVDLQLSGSTEDDDWVEHFIHDEGYVPYLEAQYGLMPDFCVKAYQQAVSNWRSNK